ncbi:uncharacterized protein ALTATR162_LOCUS158 [Alternaria atra]|uniref:Carbohydrate kinase FGGY C-terminal domain-containing protein n=1 Tax=Alternaria atra TaxID=119953 RepID=A0A8J2HSR8_9PLEO|nr:uncharacterized protein ALTATR162_LOCUS158 [Alternaria atra]CAG5137581.1 unnamed protein product [Alternaria atra]
MLENRTPTSQILDRLDYLISVVESGSLAGSIAYGRVGQPTIDANAHPQSDDTKTNSATCDVVQDKDMSNHGQEYFGSSEDILGWPIFEGNYNRHWVEARIFDPTFVRDDLHGSPHSPRVNDDFILDQSEDPRSRSKMGPGVREEDVAHLVEAFLLNVHVKNPIFDPEYLRRMARTVAEDGFDWKASSCLVLIVCALAAISSPFSRQQTCDTSTCQDRADNSLSNTPGYYTAELYYTASRKRIGLLGNSLLATECYFMAGVYEMYSLRPLQAATSFNRACVTFQALTRMNPEYSITECQLGKARASRLYWSCLKSEHETSIEFRFPSSGLTKLNYTSHFPPPPLATTTQQLYRIHTELQMSAANSARAQVELEKGWYYYLADIAARGILQRVIRSFYATNESAWLDASLQSILQTAEELDRQLTEWYRTLPDVIAFDIGVAADDELAYHLQARAFEIKERIYRPFLYLMIHKNIEGSDRDFLRPLVQLHAATCCKLIRQWNVRHRHHGTWLMARQSFSSALLLLAARRSGLHEISKEQHEESVQFSLATLCFWEEEAPDLKASLQRAVADGAVDVGLIRGIGFDATCSLAVFDSETDEPISVTPPNFVRGPSAHNVMLWLDHRAEEETKKINSTAHNLLRYVGGTMSIEMEMPKILWLKNNMPEQLFDRCSFYDLTDALGHLATGNEKRSNCSAVCKQGYIPIGVDGSTTGWQEDFLREIGLASLAEDGFKRVGGVHGKNGDYLSAGELAGHLCERAAEELGLPVGIPVGSGVIDAYAGWIGTVGAKVDGLLKHNPDRSTGPSDVRQSFTRLAAVSGTSTCHLVMSSNPVFVEGVWGPYRDAITRDTWMAEGGQSATGKLLQHVLETHPAYQQAALEAESAELDIFEFLNRHLCNMQASTAAPSIPYLARHFFFYGDLYGNRSPVADSRMSGCIVGLTADVSIDSLAIHYCGTMEFIALQTRQIVIRMNESGHAIRSIFMSGSQCKNELLVSLVATACSMAVVIPHYTNAAVCHGAAMLGAKAATAGACGKTDDLWSIMQRMSKPGRAVWPIEGQGVRELLDVKYKVFLEQCDRQRHFRHMVDDVCCQ